MKAALLAAAVLHALAASAGVYAPGLGIVDTADDAVTDSVAVLHAPAATSEEGGYEMQFLPQVIPPTPQAAALARYGEYPVSHSTGIPDISIPLYEIDLGGYKLPISISYHASGFRPDDVATPVGLGWVLNAGGAVTRTIMGAPDFEINETYDTTYRNIDTVRNLVNGLLNKGTGEYRLKDLALKGQFSEWDTESDRYTFNIPGMSGVFRYSHNDHSFISLNHAPVKINIQGIRESTRFSIDIPDGTVYSFDEQEHVGVNDDEGMPFTSSWMMTSVNTPYGDIEFSYIPAERYDIRAYSKTYYAGTGYTYVPPEASTWAYDKKEHKIFELESYTAYVYKQKLISSITWKGGRIDFSYTPDRKDSCYERLTSIKVTASDGSVIKTVTLDNPMYIGDTKLRDHCRMLLSGINDSREGKYSFAYYNTSGELLPTPLGYGKRDYWGYYNGHTGRVGIPQRVYEAIMTGYPWTMDKFAGTDRNSDEQRMMRGMLRTITHPTGGSTTFTYEANRWYDTDGYKVTRKTVGGLRIREIYSSGNRRRYEYDDMLQPYDPDMLMTYKGKWTWSTNLGPVTHDVHIAVTSPMIPVSKGGPVAAYRRVTEINGDGSHTVYEYDNGMLDPGYEYPNMMDHPAMYPSARYDEGNDTPNLTARKVYDADGTPVITEDYDYEGVAVREFAIGVRIASKYSAWSTRSGCSPEVWHPQEVDYYPDFLEYGPVTATAKAFNRVRKRVTDHVTGVVTEETFTYDPQLRTLKPRSVTVAGSDGSRDSTRYEFPFDRTDSVSRFMAEYMPDAVMSVRRFRDGVPAQRTEYSYGIDGTKYWALMSAVSTAYGDATLQERERVLSRGAGYRPTAILVNATDTTRIGWDTTGLYPLKVTAPGGMTTRYEWKPLTGVTLTVDPRDYKVAYGYDSAGRLTSVRDARGTMQTFAYSILKGPYGQQSENSVTTMRHINASGTRVTDRQYHDALGRPTLLAQGGMNTAGTYVYTLQTYDAVGRVADTWLPVDGGTSLAGQTESSIATLARSTYSDSHAYSTASYDGAGRPVRSTTPGDLWHAAGKGRDIIRFTNAANSVRRYSAPVDRVSLVKDGYYPAGSLHGEKTVDEDGRSLTVFTDKYGRKVLERRGAGNDTYFVYNIYGQLRYVLSPEYQTAGYKDEYAYEYRYDARGNVVKRYIPGCGYTQYWYDRADRLTFLQDPTLREKGFYRFFLYDRAGRAAVQGTCSSCVRSETPNPVTYRHGAPGVCATGYVMKDVSRITAPVLESATYYDSYTLPVAFTPLKLASPPSAITTGLPTATMSRASDGTTLRSISYYDGFGRVNEVRSTGLRGRLAISNTFYSYTDKPVKTRFREGDVTVTTDYTYDTATDLLLSRRVMTNVGNGDYSAAVATYAYDPLGRIAKVTLGNSAGAVEYTYDLHGRLRSVSHPSFSQRLFYADGPGTHLYNGSVSAMMWLTPDLYRWRGYKYTYNNLGWLTRAEYGENETIATDKNHYTVSILDFSENGSIRRLQRHGRKDDGIYGKIDNLHLNYDGNRLVSVVEDADHVTREGANDFIGRGKAYTYNSAGALTSDMNRKISKITYDNLNRPVRLDIYTGSFIDYAYSPDGTRLRTIHNTPLIPVATEMPDRPSLSRPVRRDTLEYSGPVVYENGKVKRVLFDGGYATFSDVGVPNWHYFLCDHTGSVRVVADMWGRAEQINHYYPFGLPFADAGKGADLQPYKFGGKELDAMYGLHTYDFHARTLIPDLCRFDRPDQLAEKYPHLSPYLFCANDPVNNTDPTGMDIWFNDFMYVAGCEYFGDDDFVRRCVQAMNIVYQSGGDKLIDDLVASESIFSFVPGSEDKSYISGENYGNAQSTINTALGRDEFISAIAHESMHMGQYLNGQGGKSIFNEVEANAFEAIISFNYTIESYPNDKIISVAPSGTPRYRNNISTLQHNYNENAFTDAMFLFKRESEANNTGIYSSYSLMPRNRAIYHSNINSMLLKYSPWGK